MFMDFTIPVPVFKGRVFIKNVRGFRYVHYQYDSVYDPVKKYSNPKRTTIGKLDENEPSRMYPNPNYYKFFPDESLPELSSSPRSSCLKVGSYIVIKKIIHEYLLQPMIRDIVGKKYGLFLDLVAYTIVCENNAGQYYPDYAYNHPLFTEDMKMYSDSSVSEFLRSITVDDSVSFLNAWNDRQDHREKIYISYDSTNKKSQAGDIDCIEVGHSKNGIPDTIFNYSIAYDRNNRVPLFYEQYPGSITDVAQLQQMIEKAKSFGYKNVGFILDRGYFCKENIRYMDANRYSFVIMMKGMKPLVRELVQEAGGTFETKWSERIRAYSVSGTTVERKLFPSDETKRYFHIYYSDYKAASEKDELAQTLDQMEDWMKEHQGEEIELGGAYSYYYDLIYWHKDQKDQKFMTGVPKEKVIEESMDLCGYFVIITSEKMSAKEALLLYKSRDDSEKLFRGDKSYLGNRSNRVYSNESFRSKIFIEFAALIVRNRIYTSLTEKMKADGKKNYLNVPAAIRELEKIEMIRYGNSVYKLDHALSKTQKHILSAFDIDANYMKKELGSLSTELEAIEKQYGKKSDNDRRED
ncbi:MAG: transposase [Lachnospiraceae bacterium]|nr:transposase [Lachnospiraceae bacterium]